MRQERRPPLASTIKNETDPQSRRVRAAISAIEPDWSRERAIRLWDPPRRLLAAIRGYQRNRNKGPLAALRRKYWAVQHRFWSVVTQAEIDLNCEVGGGLLIPHPNGIVIHPDVKIGPNCLIFQQVTIGSRENDGVPVIGGHVDIGAGAKVLGSITLHDHCIVGANAVVISDVPSGATVVGIPARQL